MQTVAVLGLGYVGLLTAVVFAYEGYRVIGADIDAKKVETVNANRRPLHGPNLDKCLKALSLQKEQT